MKINDVIRSRRQELGLTQEGLAARLGVSAPAVNKWEKALNYPDITLLPALARALGVDLNTLLSFQEEITQEEIGLFLNQVYETAGQKGIKEAFDLAQSKLQEFPNSDLLAYSLAGLLDGLLMMCPDTEGEGWAEQEKLVDALYERSGNSSDPKVREWACSTLAGKCIGRGELQRAESLLAQLPDSHMRKRTLTATLRQKEGRTGEAWELFERELLECATDIQTNLLHLLELALEEENQEHASVLSDTAAQVGKILGPMDYASLSVPFQLASAEKDGPRALAILEQMLESLLHPWDMSRLYPHIPPKEGEADNCCSLIVPILDEIERDPDGGFLRETPGYQEMAERFRRIGSDGSSKDRPSPG